MHRLDYDWSLAGLVKGRTETRPDGTWRVDFEYDRRGRLTREFAVRSPSIARRFHMRNDLHSFGRALLHPAALRRK